MSITDEKHRLERREWHVAVSRAFHRHDEIHAISSIRARKHVAALTAMVAECGVTGVIHALGSAIKIAVQNDRGAVRDPYLTEKNAARVKRFASTLRRRHAADDVAELRRAFFCANYRDDLAA
jgi:hypothetical protein